MCWINERGEKKKKAERTIHLRRSVSRTREPEIKSLIAGLDWDINLRVNPARSLVICRRLMKVKRSLDPRLVNAAPEGNGNEVTFLRRQWIKGTLSDYSLITRCNRVHYSRFAWPRPARFVQRDQKSLAGNFHLNPSSFCSKQHFAWPTGSASTRSIILVIPPFARGNLFPLLHAHVPRKSRDNFNHARSVILVGTRRVI